MYNGLYRAFTQEYRDYLDRRGGWPPDSRLSEWFKETCGYKGGTNTAMRRGELAPEKYTHGFVQLLVRGDDDVELRQARLATTDFVSRFGIEELSPATAGAVLGHICDPAVEKPEEPDSYIDYLGKRIHRIADIAPLLGRLDSHVRGCPAEQIPEAIRWMYVRVAHSTAAEGRSLHQDKAIGFAQIFMGIEKDRYAANARRWAEANPWTVVRAWQKGTPVGVSIVLPVTASFYRAVLDGEQTPYQCRPEDIQVPSTHLILEAVAEKPEALGTSRLNPTRSLIVCLLFQLAALSRCNRFNTRTEIRMLSFAGTPKNEERMTRTGFVPTGRTMHRPKLRLFERKFDVGHLGATDIFSGAALYFIGALCPSSPRMDDN
ncbi:MAG: hypothetical protein ACKVXR_04780 [Planctomycetota bacterium]